MRILLAVFVSIVLLAGGARARQAQVGLVEIEGAPVDAPGPLDWLAGGDPTFRQILQGLHSAARDPNLRSVVLRLKDAELGPTHVEELGEAIARLRARGKQVIVYSDLFGPSELLLGAAADRVLAQPGAPVSLPGIYMEEIYLADTLAWLGLEPDFVQIGDYKGASEPLARNAPSPEWDRNINQLLDGLYGQMTGRLRRGRGLEPADLDAAMHAAWLADASDAVRVRLIDAEVDLASLDEHLGRTLGAAIEWREDLVQSQGSKVDMSNPFAFLQILTRQPERAATGPTIAVLHLIGTIVDGESSPAGFLGGDTIGSRSVRRELESILSDDNIKGLVVRIDSPGGSATASEIIWQGLRRVAAKKPVWASVGSMAASGGYYIAVGCDRIHVNPSSIVGSIGVVGGKIAMPGLYQWARVNVVPRSRGPRASMFSTVQRWTDEERDLVRGKMTQTYNLFVSRVAAGRKGIDLARTTEGRLFIGAHAVELRMADKVAGLHTTIEDLARHLGLDSYDVMDFPGPQSLEEILDKAMKGMPFLGVQSPHDARTSAALAQELLGPRAWRQIRAQVQALALLRRHPVVLVSPRALVFR